MKISLRRYFFGLYIFPFLICCASSHQSLLTPLTPEIREEFDPQTLNDDDFLVDLRSHSLITSHSDLMPNLIVESGPPNGYRVQIAAVLKRAQAEMVQAQAEAKLQTSVYVNQDSHLYKIQVGNAQTSGQAEKLRQNVKAAGFLEAYVVHARIEPTLEKHSKPVQKSSKPGFRIQIFSSSNQNTANQIQTKARFVLERKDIYVEYEPPFFKVRVGNFKHQTEAIKTLEAIKKGGYQTSFLVQTQIMKNLD